VSRAARAKLSSPRFAVPLALAVAFVGFLVLWVVGLSSSSNVKPAAASRPPTVELRRTKLGRVLVDAHGHTLYLFLEDPDSRSSCYAGCARVWPPLLVSGAPKAGPGVDGTKLVARTRRHSRLRQVVYNGHPLYTTVADERAGQVEGQAFLGTWFAVSPKGKQVGKAAKGAGGY
jgi:predicted lipoprotein with Yx(FWY)xxD motif